jgi:hypothetical protein
MEVWMNGLTEKEEKLLVVCEKIYKKYKLIVYLLMGIGLPIVVIHDLSLAFKVRNYDPILSRDHFWLAGMFGSWIVLFFSSYLREIKMYGIIQKLRKQF